MITYPLLAWFGWHEMLIVAGVFVLLFGSAKLPTLMRNMGRSVNEFKAGMTDKPAGLEKDEEGDDDESSEDES